MNTLDNVVIKLSFLLNGLLDIFLIKKNYLLQKEDKFFDKSLEQLKKHLDYIEDVSNGVKEFDELTFLNIISEVITILDFLIQSYKKGDD